MNDVLQRIYAVFIARKDLGFMLRQRETILWVFVIDCYGLDIIDRTVAADAHLIVGSTNHPDTMRQAFVQPGRFERVVEVTPAYPGDFVEALKIHSAASEKRAGHTLFDNVDWKSVVEHFREPSTADWIRIMHAVLRRKARREASGETTTARSQTPPPSPPPRSGSCGRRRR